MNVLNSEINKYRAEIRKSVSLVEKYSKEYKSKLEVLRYTRQKLSEELLVIDENLQVMSESLSHLYSQTVLSVFEQERKREINRKDDILKDLEWLERNIRKHDSELDKSIELLQGLHDYEQRLNQAESGGAIRMLEDGLNGDQFDPLRHLLDQVESLNSLDDLAEKYL